MLKFAVQLVNAKDRLVSKATKLFRNDEEGASLVEYGLLVALIACACIAAITALGGSISGLFNGIGTVIDNNVPS
jgi:Flp pilus assembly pilin Flp